MLEEFSDKEYKSNFNKRLKSNLNLFLDDDRTPYLEPTSEILPKGLDFEIVRNYQEFIEFFHLYGIPKFVSFDMDLCAEHYAAYLNLGYKYIDQYQNFKEKCGIDCVTHLIRICYFYGTDFPEYQIHSLNNFVKEYCIDLIEKFNKNRIWSEK